MLADATHNDLFDELRRAWVEGERWGFWRAPEQPPRFHVGASDQLVAMPFDVERRPDGEPGGYEARVEAALRAIEQGLVEKVVVARREVHPPADPIETLRELEIRFPSCFVFATSDGDDVFLGATPELLASFRGRELRTCALAGTAAPGDDSLLTSDKDRREHQLVIDAIRDTLEPLCEELEVGAEATLLTLPNVQHLHTEIRGSLRPGIDERTVVGALHPTPAVCGTPRDAARRLIAELEPFDRGLYAGVIGWRDEHGSDYAVAIRSARLTREATYVFAGAGIVRGSAAANEELETRAKLRAVTDALRPR